MVDTPDVNHADAREFFGRSMDTLTGTVGAIFNRRDRSGQDWIGPITEDQWKSLYAIAEKILEYVLSIRP